MIMGKKGKNGMMLYNLSLSILYIMDEIYLYNIDILKDFHPERDQMMGPLENKEVPHSRNILKAEVCYDSNESCRH